MGPRSGDRGQGTVHRISSPTTNELQWVHGQVTVVRSTTGGTGSSCQLLQWVHGQVTVVRTARHVEGNANAKLQWVHGQVTVVRWPPPHHQCPACRCFNGSTVR